MFHYQLSPLNPPVGGKTSFLQHAEGGRRKHFGTSASSGPVMETGRQADGGAESGVISAEVGSSDEKQY